MSLGEKAHALIKELDRNRDTLPPYNNDLVKEVKSEIQLLVTQNQEDAQVTENSTLDTTSYLPTVKIRHAIIKRNIRCLLAYHHNRIQNLRTMRWEFGTVLPQDVKTNMSSSEMEWFSKYSSNLARYMRTIGEEGGINLATNLKPPKSLYVEVKCVVDYGNFELNDGSVLLLKKNSTHYLPRNECEVLIRQGIFEHVV